MSRRGARLYHACGNRDRNERPIIDALEAQGFCVTQLRGKGVPDLLVGKRGIDRVWLVEIKQPNGSYTKAQNDWRAKWSGPPPITLRSVEDAGRFMLLACEGGRDHEVALRIGLRQLERQRVGDDIDPKDIA